MHKHTHIAKGTQCDILPLRSQDTDIASYHQGKDSGGVQYGTQMVEKQGKYTGDQWSWQLQINHHETDHGPLLVSSYQF